MKIFDKAREKYELKGLVSPEDYLGSDYILDQNLKEIISEDAKGITYARHDESDKYISTIWLKKNINSLLSKNIY